MARINEIELKNVKTFLDHERCPISQGNVYYRGKKLGFYSEDYSGGPNQYDFDTRILDEAVKDFVASEWVEPQYKEIADLDILIYELLKVRDDEKSFKQGLKRGFDTFTVATDGYHIRGYSSIGSDPAYHKNFIKNCEKEFFENAKIDVKVYHSLDDFNIVAKAA